MKDLTMNLFRFILALLMVFPLSACSLSSGPIEGRVLEEGTDKPIPGAIVVVRWIGRTTSGSMFVEARDVCYHVESGLADEKGRYHTKGWSQKQHKDYTLEFEQVLVIAYKEGYRLSQTVLGNSKDVYLTQFSGSDEERLNYLKRFFGGVACGSENESEKNMLPLLSALYKEASRYRETNISPPDKMSFLESIKYDMEIIDLGFEEAEKRHLRRN